MWLMYFLVPQCSALDWLSNFLNSFWQGLKDLVMDSFSWLLDNVFGLIKYLIDAILLVIQTAFLWILDGMLTLVAGAVNSLSLGSIGAGYFAQWGLVPPQLVYFLNQTGVSQGLTLIFYALTVRLTLNLIPGAITRV